MTTTTAVTIWKKNERSSDKKAKSDSCASLLKDHLLKSSQYDMTCMRHMNAYFGVIDIIVSLTMVPSWKCRIICIAYSKDSLWSNAMRIIWHWSVVHVVEHNAHCSRHAFSICAHVRHRKFTIRVFKRFQTIPDWMSIDDVNEKCQLWMRRQNFIKCRITPHRNQGLMESRVERKLWFAENDSIYFSYKTCSCLKSQSTEGYYKVNNVFWTHHQHDEH